jgi:hypothetical protein
VTQGRELAEHGNQPKCDSSESIRIAQDVRLSFDSARAKGEGDGSGPMDKRWRIWRAVLWSVMCCTWLAQGLSGAPVNPDGVSYLDIASACLKGNFSALINGVWSPLYSVLLTFWLFLFRPSAPWEARIVRLFNCGALVFAACCFEYLLNGLAQYQEAIRIKEQQDGLLPPWVLRATGYSLFFFASVYMTPAELVNPDVLVMAFVLLAAGLMLRIRIRKDGALSFAVLGLVLGLGYLAKTVMFPVGLAFLVGVLFAVRNFRRATPRILLAAFLFLAVSGPFIFALSKSKGRLTFGDSGAISYAVLVNGATFAVHWQGQPPGTGTPKHPTRKILATPPVYEYAEPIGGSYPPWTDPSYWYDGIRPHFVLAEQLRTLRNSIAAYRDTLGLLWGIVAGFLVFLFWGGSIRRFVNNVLQETFLWGPAVAAMGMYALVRVEPRYLSGFIMLVWAAAFLALRIPEPGHAIVRSVTLTIVVLLGFQTVLSFKKDIVTRPASGSPTVHCAVAQDLWREGVKPGDRVAYVGAAVWYHYWAHLAQVSVVTEVASEGVAAFWAASPQLRAKVTDLLATTGAKAVVSKDVPPRLLADGWKEVPHTNYYVLVLRR